MMVRGIYCLIAAADILCFNVGCMVVELLDYRPQKSKEPAPKNPEKTRVILHPNPETLWADVCSLNQRHGGKWTDMDALEVEAKLLVHTPFALSRCSAYPSS